MGKRPKNRIWKGCRMRIGQALTQQRGYGICGRCGYEEFYSRMKDLNWDSEKMQNSFHASRSRLRSMLWDESCAAFWDESCADLPSLNIDGASKGETICVWVLVKNCENAFPDVSLSNFVVSVHIKFGNVDNETCASKSVRLRGDCSHRKVVSDELVAPDAVLNVFWNYWSGILRVWRIQWSNPNLLRSLSGMYFETAEPSLMIPYSLISNLSLQRDFACVKDSIPTCEPSPPRSAR